MPSLCQRRRRRSLLASGGFVRWSRRAAVQFPKQCMSAGRKVIRMNAKPWLRSLKRPIGQKKLGVPKVCLLTLGSLGLAWHLIHAQNKDMISIACFPYHPENVYTIFQWMFCIDCTQDLFVSRITKTVSKTSKLSKRKKRGWFTKENMANTLQWSAFLSSKTCSFGNWDAETLGIYLGPSVMDPNHRSFGNKVVLKKTYGKQNLYIWSMGQLRSESKTHSLTIVATQGLHQVRGWLLWTHRQRATLEESWLAVFLSIQPACVYA